MKNSQRGFVAPLLIGIILSCLLLQSKTTIASVSPSPLLNNQETVILVIDNNLYQDSQVNAVIQRYKMDYAAYNFITILFNKTSNPVTDQNSIGGAVKQNSLEVRNTIKQIYSSQKANLIGVFIIGNVRPTIWRDANLWRSLGQSGFYPSVYPYVALDSEYYLSFDVANDGFYEKSGMTTGSEIGGGYNASIWGATLIPPVPYVQPPCPPGFSCNLTTPVAGITSLSANDLIINYFNRDHAYITKQLKYSDKLLYSDSFGCSSSLYQKISSNSIWGKTSNTFLCPNLNPQLNGFDSVYQVLIHNRGTDYDPTKTGFGSIAATTNEEQVELDNWSRMDYFGNSTLSPHGGPSDYYFLLHVKGKSITTKQIETTLQSKLPNIVCGRVSNCLVYASEFGFEESDGSWGGQWSSYSSQQAIWTNLYTSLLKNSNFELTSIRTHGSPMSHLFNITSDIVKSGKFNSMIYEIESCNTGNYLSPDYIAGDYLFYGNTLGVSAYSIPFLLRGEGGYFENDVDLRFLKIEKNQPIINALFLKNYGNYIYLGDPLLQLGDISPTTLFPTITFTATPNPVTLGQSTTVSWSTTNATTCSSNPAIKNSPAVWTTPTTSGSFTLPSSSITLTGKPSITLKLTCTGSGGTASSSLSVQVIPATTTIATTSSLTTPANTTPITPVIVPTNRLAPTNPVVPVNPPTVAPPTNTTPTTTPNIATTSPTTNPVTQTKRESVRQLYLTLMQREPDQQGWDYWTNSPYSVDQIRTMMMNTTEYRNRISATQNPTPSSTPTPTPSSSPEAMNNGGNMSLSAALWNAMREYFETFTKMW
jgi:hypothetical protein